MFGWRVEMELLQGVIGSIESSRAINNHFNG